MEEVSVANRREGEEKRGRERDGARERRGEGREKERERDHLIWERAQTICGNGLKGSRGQIPDRWKKLNMGQSVFLGPENSSCFTVSSHKAWPIFLFCLSPARCVS